MSKNLVFPERAWSMFEGPQIDGSRWVPFILCEKIALKREFIRRINLALKPYNLYIWLDSLELRTITLMKGSNVYGNFLLDTIHVENFENLKENCEYWVWCVVEKGKLEK